MLSRKIFLETNVPLFGFVLITGNRKKFLSNKETAMFYTESGRCLPIILTKESTYLISDYFDFSNSENSLDIGFPCFINYETVKNILSCGAGTKYYFYESVCLPEDCLLTDLEVIMAKRVILPQDEYKIQGFVMSILANTLKDWKDLIFGIKIHKKEDDFSILIIGNGFHVEVTKEHIYGFLYPKETPTFVWKYTTSTACFDENKMRKCFVTYPHTRVSIDYSEKDTNLQFVIRNLIDMQKKAIFGYAQNEYAKLAEKYTELQKEKTMIEEELKCLEERMAKFRWKTKS